MLHRFVLRQNIKRFERALATCDDPNQRRILLDLLEDAKRELAALPADPSPTSRPPPRQES